MTLDEVRSRFPHLGFAVYALDAGGPVTLEAHDPGGELWSWTAPTEAEALAKAFPRAEAAMQEISAISQKYKWSTVPMSTLPAGNPVDAYLESVGEAGGVAETAGSVFD